MRAVWGMSTTNYCSIQSVSVSNVSILQPQTTTKIENREICFNMYRRSRIRLLLSLCSLLFLSGGFYFVFKDEIIFLSLGSLIQLLHFKDAYHVTSFFNFSLSLKMDPVVDWESKIVSLLKQLLNWSVIRQTLLLHGNYVIIYILYITTLLSNNK